MSDWQTALEAARARLDQRDREREDEQRREAEARLRAECPEPERVETVVAKNGERVWCAWTGSGRRHAHPSREEAVRLWKAEWVERERERSAHPMQVVDIAAADYARPESLDDVVATFRAAAEGIADRMMWNQAEVSEGRVLKWGSFSADPTSAPTFAARYSRDLLLADIRKAASEGVVFGEVRDPQVPAREQPPCAEPLKAGDKVEVRGIATGGTWRRGVVQSVDRFASEVWVAESGGPRLLLIESDCVEGEHWRRVSE